MILNRLYELAEWANLLTDASIVRTPVACVIKVGRTGDFNGIVDLREEITLPGKGPRGKPKVRKNDGLSLPVPVRPVVWDAKTGRWKTTDPASSGADKPAVFLADTLARVLPIEGLIADKDRVKCQAQRSTFWRFLAYAAEQTKDPALAVFRTFGERLMTLTDEHRQRIEKEVTDHKLSAANLCTLEWTADEGPVLQRKPILDWWRGIYEVDRAAQEAGEYRGLCQVTRRVRAISNSIKSRISGLIPVGCRAEAYLVTGLGSAESYGLSGASNAMVSAEAVDGFTRALNALIANELPSRKDKSRVGGVRSSLRVGPTQFLFWTRDMESTGLEILDASPDQFAALFDSLQKTVASGQVIPEDQQDQFRVLAVSGNSARVVVRDYLEGPLPRIQLNLLKWFADLRIADTSKEHQGRPNAVFPLWMLANATALEAVRVAPDTHARLMHAALTGGPVPDSILAACLARLRVPERDPKRPQFSPARMALIKLCLNRIHCLEDNPMPESLDSDRIRDKAYLCGRLLAFLARCQSPKDFGTSAQIVERFFGSAMLSPRAVFPTLIKLNRHHISIIRGQKKGFAFNLEQEIDRLCDLLRPEGGELPDFPATHTLAQQGRFALGFYQQRAEYRRVSADKKLDEAAELLNEQL